MTRTQNSFFNIVTSLGSSLMLVLLNFITRSVFIRYLGTSYLGIEGLFSNILSVLSLAELGIGSAIIFKLYKPIEEQNRARILVLMKLYRQVYFFIGTVIAVLGLCLIPFLPRLVQDYERFAELGLNAVLVFIIYLFNTVSSYWFFAYKTSYVQANQKTYILTVTGYAVTICSFICQILSLILLRSFMLFVLVQVFFTVVKGFVGAIICNKRYPFTREKTDERISKQELRDFIKDCSALLLYRVHNVVINASNNIVLSAVWGLDAVGLYANYLSVKNSLRAILDTIITSVQASLGSIYTTGNLSWSNLMFRVVNILVFWMYGIGAIGLCILLDEFITLWLGSSVYTITFWTIGSTKITTPVSLLVGIEMFVIGYRQYFAVFREAMGLFRQMKYRPVASVIVNLIVLIPCVQRLGPIGCVISTIVAGLTTNMIFDPIIIHKHALKTSVRPYFLRNALYSIVVIVAGLISWWVCSLILLDGFLGFIVHGCVCVAIPCCVFTACFFRTVEFKFLLNTVKTMLVRKTGNN